MMRERSAPASLKRLEEVAAGEESAMTTVASYARYEEAQRAVDFLSDRGFPVEHLSIVAHGVRVVESVTGRFRYPQALLQGLTGGALTGLFFGFVFGLFSWVEPLISGLTLAVYGAVFGAIVGGLLGLAGRFATRGRRDFASVAALDADRYDLRADPAVAEEARLAVEEQQRQASNSQLVTTPVR